MAENCDGNQVESGADPKDLITREFLQNALKKEGLNADHEIISFDIQAGSKPGDNYMSLIYSIDLKLKAPNGNTFTRYWLIKCYPNHPGRQQFTNKTNMFYKELQVYSEWIPELYRFQKQVLGFKEDDMINLPYVKYVHGECIDFQSQEGSKKKSDVIGSLDNYIIMEDAKKTGGFRMTDRKVPMDMDHINLAVEALAKVHAISWAFKKHVEEDVIGKYSCFTMNLDDEDIDMMSKIVHQNIQMTKDVLDEELGAGNELSKAMSRFQDKVKVVFDCFAKRATEQDLGKAHRYPIDEKKYPRDIKGQEIPWRVITHGDCWSNNMLFRYDETTGKPLEIILLDLQMPSESCVVPDLEYVLYTGPSSQLRRQELDNWLQLYHRKFNEWCNRFKCESLPEFTINELRFRFHRAKPLGFYMGIMMIPIKLMEKAVDMESLDKDVKIDEMMNQVFGNKNKNANSRIVDFVQELYDDGLI